MQKKLKEEFEETEDDEYEEIKGDSLNIWLPQIGDILEGRILSIGKNDYGLFAEIDTKESQEPIITPARTILQSKIEKCYVGDYIRITYTDDIKTASGRMASNFEVRRKK